MPAIWELKRNWTTYQMWKLILVTEDMCSVTTDSTKWVSPYNTSYWYTNITISADSGITWVEWYSYRFEILTKLIVASAYRNVRIRIWNWNRMPVKNRANSILAWSSYFVKWRTDLYVFRTAYESGWALHLQANSDTTYSVMSVAEWKTATATSSRIVRSDYLKQIIEYHAGNLDNALISGASYSDSWDWDTHAPTKNAVYDKISTMDTTISWKADSSAIPTKTSQLTNDSWFINDTYHDSSKYDASNPNWYTSNQWTITGITMNGSSKWTSGVVDLWTVITSHQDISWKQDKLTAWEWISIENNVISTTSAWNMSSLVQFWRTWWRWTKAMFNALPNKDVNGVYVILSEKDYKKMIND